jgi:hypothetical protein
MTKNNNIKIRERWISFTYLPTARTHWTSHVDPSRRCGQLGDERNLQKCAFPRSVQDVRVWKIDSKSSSYVIVKYVQWVLAVGKYVRTMVLWIRMTGSVFVSKMSKHDVSPREGLVTTDAKYDDQLSKIKFLSLVNFLLCKSIRESDESRSAHSHVPSKT